MTKTPTDETAHESGARDGDHERIAKVLARAGLCSRREAEEWVTAGRVAVDGVVLTTPATTVGPQNVVTVDGKPLPVKERTRLWLFHKPRGLVTTTSDPEGRPTVFSVLPDDMPRVVTIGRLDINTEGLLLLTNDGGLARVLELPSTGWLRRYRVRAFGDVDQKQLDELKAGISLDGVDYGPIEAAIDRVQGSNVWLVLGLREGKNREVKRVLGALGLVVNRLIRISFGPFQLGDLEEGEIREIRGRVLRDQLGRRLVEESGADFDAPLVHQMHGGDVEDVGAKRRVKSHGTAEDERSGGRGGDKGARGRPRRTEMEFIGTGERRRDDDRGDRRFRSEGFRGRAEGPGKPKSAGFRDRPGGGPAGGRPRGDDGEGRSGRPRPFGAGGDRPFRSEGFRDRPGAGGKPKSAGFRDRPRDEARGGESGRGRPYRDDRPARDDRPNRDERPRSGGFRDRPSGGERGGGKPERFRDDGRRDAAPRPRRDGGEDRPMRSEGFRGRPEGDGRPRSAGFRDRPEGDGKPKSAGGRARPDTAGFGPRGPRGMTPGGRKGGRDGGEPRGGPSGGGKPGGKGPRPGKPRGAPRKGDG